jgi:hypothetical protein
MLMEIRRRSPFPTPTNTSCKCGRRGVGESHCDARTPLQASPFAPPPHTTPPPSPTPLCSSVFQTTGRYCTDFFNLDSPDPAAPFMFSGTAAQVTSAVAVTLNNRCTSSAACCTRVWCHSSNVNNCFDVRYSTSFSSPPGSTAEPLSPGALAGAIIGGLLLLCCMTACIAFVRHMCGIREDTPQTTTYHTTINPSTAASVQAWGSAGPQAQGDMHKLSSSAAQQPSHPQGMHAVVAPPTFTPQPAPTFAPQPSPTFAPQAYPPPQTNAPLPRQGPQQPANNGFIPQPAPFFPDNN